MREKHLEPQFRGESPCMEDATAKGPTFSISEILLIKHLVDEKV